MSAGGKAYVMDFGGWTGAEAVSPLVSDNRIFAVDDPYRYSNIKGAPSSARSKYGFGSATHYGQDFIFKSPSDRVYVLSVPYPFSSKESVSRFQTATVSYTHLTLPTNREV